MKTFLVMLCTLLCTHIHLLEYFLHSYKISVNNRTECFTAGHHKGNSYRTRIARVVVIQKGTTKLLTSSLLSKERPCYSTYYIGLPLGWSLVSETSQYFRTCLACCWLMTWLFYRFYDFSTIWVLDGVLKLYFVVELTHPMPFALSFRRYFRDIY